MQPGHREVAGKHAALRPEAIDTAQRHLAQTVEGPVVIVGDQIGDLDGDVGRLRETGQRLRIPSASRSIGLPQ